MSIDFGLIFFHLGIPLFGHSVTDTIEQLPEFFPMVVLTRMAQLVQQNVVDQVIGKAHQMEVEVDVACGGTASPSRF